MDQRSIFYKLLGLLVFLVTFIIYYNTAQVSVSFWDCGECAAAAYNLQVPHPPGSPAYTIIGRLFSMLPFAENIGFRINLLSVFVSALSCFLVYFIMIKIIENYKQRNYKNRLDEIATYLSAFIGALACGFSHSFWFNATESELYATNTLVFISIIYFILLWNEKYDQPGNEKYLLLIAYLIGISSTLRMFGVLAIVPIAMIIIYRKVLVDEEILKKSIYVMLLHIAAAIIIYFFMLNDQVSTTPPSPEEYKAFDNKFLIIIGIVSILIMGIFRKYVFNINSIYLPVFIGVVVKFIVHPGIFKYVPLTLGLLSGDNFYLAGFFIALILGVLFYAIYYTKKRNLQLATLSLMFVTLLLFGYSMYAYIVIRANQDPPMNENAPKTFSQFVSYLNREQYGDWPTFKRRFSAESHQAGIYTRYSSDLDFLWRYQMNHMMTRYILWMFSGREHWTQDGGPNAAPFNKTFNLIGRFFNLRFGGDVSNSMFGIPFLVGLVGIVFHFRRDWKMALAILFLFLFVSYLFAFYQNQQEPQPRERDKFYAAVGFVFSIWIAVAMRSFIDLVQKAFAGKSLENILTIAILTLGIIFIPARMVQANYFEHDRSRNWIPWDLAYNMLQSCEKDAILITNGDNDTFPLWYLQDVERIRTDVRIVNLSLLNTEWYSLQLKNLEPYGAKKIKFSYTDKQLAQLRPSEWVEKSFSIPIKPEDYARFGVTDTAFTKIKELTFTVPAAFEYGDTKVIRVQDLLVLDIVLNNLWERPIYFATTVSDDSYIGLYDYLSLEGIASRLVPYKLNNELERINEKILRKNLLNVNPEYSREYKPGFKFRGLNDPTIFTEENQERMVMNYRTSFLRLAYYYLSVKQDKAQALEVLNALEKYIPHNVVKMDYRILYQLATAFYSAEDYNKFNELSKDVENTLKKMLDNAGEFQQEAVYAYSYLLDLYDKRKDYKSAIEVLQNLQTIYPGDPSINAKINHYQSLINSQPKEK